MLKEFIINKNDAGQRLDRFVGKVVPALPSSLVQKYIRIKRIKVNGKGSRRDHKLVVGESVQLYVSDKFFVSAKENKASTQKKAVASPLTISKIKLDILYEDANILLLNKPAGILCYDTHDLDNNTLINNLHAYIESSGQWRARDENSFSPALCNRIDRNTSGIVIAAKNAESLRIINDKIKHREIDKFYLAAVHGIPSPEAGALTGYLHKDGKRNLVKVTKDEVPGSKYAETEYKTLETSNKIEGFPFALLECRLITGRTHQIRAQFANFCHPLLGDIKYGDKKLNEPFKEAHQALCSYKIVFAFTSDAGVLSYLDGKSFQLNKIPFVDKYFT